jgi:cytochrome c oxidase subunit 3/cytochrome o ubiquinol oxidase subunit 3
MSSETIVSPEQYTEWHLPPRGRVAMLSLIIGESALFTIFLVAYIFYLGKSLNGPTPQRVLELPIFGTACLLSSSLTIWLAERALEKDQIRSFAGWLALTILLGASFMAGTAAEWHKLIYHDHLTISTNLFGTTFFSLVGLHASHVILGLAMLAIVLILTVSGRMTRRHSGRVAVLSLYWHFVDVVWVVVFTVVYLVGR